MEGMVTARFDILVPRIANALQDPDDAREWAEALVVILDNAMEPLDDPDENRRVYANQSVAEIAAMVLEMSDWTR